METRHPVPWKLIAIWLLASTLAVLSCSLNLSAAKLNGEYLPVGNDAFYHARRILDTVHDPNSFYEFDSKIHAPEGSLLTWPWGYDYALASITRAALALGVSEDPMAILIWIPVVAVLLSCALLIVIARQLGLSTPLTALAALCLALSPTTQLLHGVGIIDHHYAEFIFVLGALAAGLAWLREPENWRRAAIAAVTLALAPLVQNGLFILQLPLLVTLFALWLQGTGVPRRSGLAFAVALMVTTVLILLPSEPFQLRRFEFYTLSWFHLYIAFCSAATVTLLSRLAATRNGIIAVLAISALLLIPILREMAIASGFIAGAPQYLRMISEMQPPLRAAALPAMGATMIANYYSHLIWLAPVTLLVCAFKGYQERNSFRLLFWITSLFGLALLLAQIRMHYFGSFALYLPWLILLQQFCERSPQHLKKSTLLGGLALLLLYFPPLRHQLLAPAVVAHDLGFRETRPILASLAKACREDPGIVLADTNVSHFIRYYTDCSVMANNFLLTPQHLEKVREVLHLLTLTPSELKSQAPQIKYVLLRPAELRQNAQGAVTYQFVGPHPRLADELLLGPEAAVSSDFELIDEVRLPELNDAVYARLYKVRGAAATR